MKLMKAIVCMSIVMLCVSEAVAGSFRDPRDGKTYKTVKMPDGETWMAENLNYEMEGSMCYGNNASNCNKYGQLYTWDAAKKACPSGWHLPSRGEFKTLLDAVGDDRSKKLRVSSWGKTWTETKQVCLKYACSYGYYGETIRDCRGSTQCNCGNGNSICLEFGTKDVGRRDSHGSDSYGFSALPAGYYSGRFLKGFFDLGSFAFFWSSTEDDSDIAYRLRIHDDGAGVGDGGKPDGSSVRCLQDSEAEIAKKRAEEEKKRAEEEKKRAVMGSFKDPRDGKKYKTVKMPDGKTWMAENLNYKMEGSSCYEDYATNCGKYGRLYTWNAALKACPSGWRLPKKKDIEKMLAVVGTDDQERSRHLRTKHEWNVKADDAYYFSALPAGYYDSNDKKFYDLGSYTGFWSSTESSSYYAYGLYVDDNIAYVDGLGKDDGDSVRCLQD